MAKKQRGAAATPPSPGADATASPPSPRKQIIYVARTARKIILRKSQGGFVKLPDGTLVEKMTAGPISAEFKHGWFRLTPGEAEMRGLTFDEMKGLIEGHSQFRTKEIWIGTEEEVAALIEAGRGRETRINRGPKHV